VAVYNSPDNVAIVNNIIGGHSIVEIVLGPGAGDGVWIDHNLYFKAPDPHFGLFRNFNDWDSISFRVWTPYLQSFESVAGCDQRGFVGDPLFEDVPAMPVGDADAYSFLLLPHSPAIDAGGWLTRTTRAGTGAWVSVQDASFFSDGYEAVRGDTIQFEGSGETYEILEIDYDLDALLLDRILTWQANQGIALPYSGSRPDLGACEYQTRESSGGL
jgi:hypothetical protein